MTAALASPEARTPKALVTRVMNPPGMSSAQLSTSMARTNAASSVAASTNHAADAPSAAPVTPAMKNAPMPS